MLKRVQHDVMSMRKQNGVIRVLHDVKIQPPLMKSALLFHPKQRCQNLRKLSFCYVAQLGFFPHEAVLFSSRGSVLGYLRMPLQEVGFVKIFTLFQWFFSPVLSPNHLHLFCILPCIKVGGQNVENAELEHKRGGFRCKNASKAGKTIFSYECRKRAKRCTKRVFWAKKRAKRTQKQRFSCKLDKHLIILIFNVLCKNRQFFALKTFAFRLHLQTVLQTST